MTSNHPNQLPLDLSNAIMIGSGTERDCYKHPHNPMLCIKVNNGKVLPNKKRYAKQSQTEYSYYQRLQKRHVQPTCIPKCYGWVETNRGRGLVFDFILNEDGTAAPRLIAALDQGLLSAEQAKELLWDLKQRMLKELIIPSDLHLDNILLQHRQSQPRLVLVDGIGNRNIIKITEQIPVLGRMKIERHWVRLWQRLYDRHSEYFPAPSKL